MDNSATKTPDICTEGNNTPRIQHIWCSVGINKKMEDVLIGFICGQAQKGDEIDEYVVYLSTMGGSPYSGITLYNFIKSLPQKTTVYNMGNVASAGIQFFLGFQTRIGVPDCSFYIHQTSMPKVLLPEQVTVFDLQTELSSLSATDDKTKKIIIKETSGRGEKSLTKPQIKKAILESHTYHTVEAQKFGFIDKVELPVLPDTGVLYITDQYLATLPG